MARPEVIWRNPDPVERRRLWNRARKDETSSLYIVVRSGLTEPNEWEGLPNLEMVEGGAAVRGKAKSRSAQSRA